MDGAEARDLHSAAVLDRMGYGLCGADSSAVIGCESHRKEKPAKLELFPYRELEMATGRFAGESLLGKGSHGSVYKGVLQCGKLVAVKKLQIQALQDGHGAFENEIEILSKLHSPRVVNLVGVSRDSKERLLVVEFMANGSLHDILHCNPQPPGWPRRAQMALQIAKAVQALHNASPPVIHRDIKSSNVLLDDNWNARLGDFGLAVRGHMRDIRLSAMPPAGTIGYLDPAYTAPAKLSAKSDVFSFGILLLEIISSRNAIDVQYHPPSIVDWALPLIRKNQACGLCDPRLGPPKNGAGIKQMAAIAARCVRSEKERRPSMNEVVEELKFVTKSFPIPRWRDLASRVKRPAVRPEKPPLAREVEGKKSNERHGRGRNLVDLLNEGTESSEAKSVDWRTLANGGSTSVTARPRMLIRSPSLPVFGDRSRDATLARANSVNAVNPALHFKQALQATVSV